MIEKGLWFQFGIEAK